MSTINLPGISSESICWKLEVYTSNLLFDCFISENGNVWSIMSSLTHHNIHYGKFWILSPDSRIPDI